VSFFNRNDVKPAKGTALPPNDPPEAAPIALPEMSVERERAIAKAISEGRARTITHALFLHTAGVLELPV